MAVYTPTLTTARPLRLLAHAKVFLAGALAVSVAVASTAFVAALT